MEQLVIAAVVGAAVGFALAAFAMNPGKHREDNLLRERDRVESERAMERMGRQVREADTRVKEQAEVFQILPELVRQMFTASGRRGISGVVVKLIDQVFHPAQAAVFMARPEEVKLRLTDGIGLAESLKGLELDFRESRPESRPGHVAVTKMAMDENDFANATAQTRRQLEMTAVRDLRAEVVAPILNRDSVLGVICIGGARTRQGQGQEKKLLKMIAELTGLALTQVGLLRDTEAAANMDGLTGTYNKRFLSKRLGDEIHKAERENGCLSLLILDIDHFKHYNDTNGHLEGDEVLKAVGVILKKSGREDDVVARYGGEEFVILYPGSPKAVAMRQAQALRQAVESHPFAHRGSQPLGTVTISGGVATFPEDAPNAVELLRAADTALYEAKAEGRNRIVGAKPNYLT